MLVITVEAVTHKKWAGSLWSAVEVSAVDARRATEKPERVPRLILFMITWSSCW